MREADAHHEHAVLLARVAVVEVTQLLPMEDALLDCRISPASPAIALAASAALPTARRMPSIICTTSSHFSWPKVTVVPRLRGLPPARRFCFGAGKLASELARRLRPARTLLVGMGHALEHVATNRRLRRLQREEGLDIQLAYDGQFVPLALAASRGAGDR